MDIMAVLMDFQRFGEIDGEMVVCCQCFETICMQKKKYEEKYMLLVSRKYMYWYNNVCR